MKSFRSVFESEIWREFWRYFVVGGMAFLVDFGLLYLLSKRVGVWYFWAAGISFLVGLCVNYLLSVAWVFRKRKIESRRVEFLLFGVVGLLGLFMNQLLMWFGVEVIGVDELITKLFATAIVFVWNFVIRKVILFW